MKYTYAALAITLCALVVSQANAAVIHPDVMGTNVNFTNIEEDSPSGDPLPLFGPPSPAGGNSIDFNPTGNFAAQSTNGGADVTDGKMSMMIAAKPGHTLEIIDFLETGLVTLLNLGGNDPFAAVVGLVDIDIVAVDGVPVPQVNVPVFDLLYGPSNGDFQHSVDATGPLFSTGWTGMRSITLDNALTAAGVPFVFGATKVNVTLNNRLLAATGALGSIAIIDKKDFDITVTTEVIPEPATIALVLTGVSLALGMLRRRSG